MPPWRGDDEMALQALRPPLILIIDDDDRFAAFLSDALAHAGYRTYRAANGFDGVCAATAERPDMVLLDVRMPDMDGFEVCTHLRGREEARGIPIVMMTANQDDKAAWNKGLEAGADDFLFKPVDSKLLLARVRTLIRTKTLFDEVSRQNEELARWSAQLERRVHLKVSEIERLARLKRFFSPRLAARLVEGGAQDPMQSHRGRVSILFADLRGFTEFSDRQEPGVVMDTLKQFHAVMGALIFRFEGTLERFTGDGMMVFFNDPDPVADHCNQALRLGLAMCEAAERLMPAWREIEGPNGLSVGISTGEATLGAIGFEGRIDYAAIGSATNLAARLCAQARAGEVLVAAETWAECSEHNGLATTSEVLTLKGFSTPVICMRIAVGTAAVRED
jgi:adenylate cyclase